jgi:hypothetical protein
MKNDETSCKQHGLTTTRASHLGIVKKPLNITSADDEQETVAQRFEQQHGALFADGIWRRARQWFSCLHACADLFTLLQYRHLSLMALSLHASSDLFILLQRLHMSLTPRTIYGYTCLLV